MLNKVAINLSNNANNVNRNADPTRDQIAWGYGQKGGGGGLESLGIFSGSPAEMLAKLVNMGGDASSILLRNQIVEANELKRNMLEGANSLRKLKQVQQQRINDLESYQSFLKEKGIDITGGKDGSAAKQLTSDEIFAFFDNNKELAQRYGITVTNNNKLMSGGKEITGLDGLGKLMSKRSYELKNGKIKCEIEDGKNNPFDAGKLGGLIESQKTDQGYVDTQLSIVNLQLQEAIQKCEQLVTLETNMQSSRKKAADAVIGNIR